MNIMLYDKYKIKQFEFKNRLIMLPTVTNFATLDGFVTKKNINYYKIRSKGPAAIICEASYTHPMGKCFPNQMGIDTDDKIEGLSKIVKAISETTIPGIQLALNVKSKSVNDLSKEEITLIRDSFVKAAIRAKKAGFQLIELHFAHGWLLNQFLSKASNKRTDKYGGNLENRMRLALEITELVRKELKDEILEARVNADDYTKDGFSLEEAIVFSKQLEKLGVDILNVTAGTGPTTYVHISPMSMPKAPLIEYVQKIKEQVDIPVMAANRLNDYEIAENILNQHKADFIGIARGLIGDPHLVEKWEKKDFEDVIPCIACNQACIAGIQSQKQLTCLMNPVVYDEPVLQQPGMYKRKILIIGAGPAGLSCAKYLKMRGMEVVLCEKESEIGGQLCIAHVPPHKAEFQKVIDYYTYIIKKLNIDLRLNTEVDLDYIRQLQSAVVVFALGAEPVVPDFAKNNPFVITSDDVLQSKKTGESVAILGAGLVGLETAQYLVKQNKNIIVFEMESEILGDMPIVLKKPFLEKLDSRIEIRTNHKVLNIKENTLSLQDTTSGNLLEKKFDTIVLALGRKPNYNLKNSFNICMDTIDIGDYKQVRDAVIAVKEGFEAAMMI
ncbi:MAG: NAD(P)/FAD-dependent oxidoreductase [Sulfurospirillum sp.]